MVKDGRLVRVGFENNVLRSSNDAIYVQLGKSHDGDPIAAWFPKSAVKVGPRGEVMVPQELTYQHKTNIDETSPYHPWH